MIHENIDISGSLKVSGSIELTGTIDGIDLQALSSSVATSLNDNSLDLSSVSQSIIPHTDVAFDLGSPTNRFRDLYLSSNTIDLGGTKISTDNSTGDIVIKDSGDNLKSIQAKEVTIGTGASKRKIKVGTNGKIEFRNSSDIKEEVDLPAGTVSGSGQVDITNTIGYSTFSSSIDSTIGVERDRIDTILLASDADKNSFSEIVTLINQVDLANDQAFANHYTASNDRLDSIELFTSSLDSIIGVVGITEEQAAAIVNNSNKVGITEEQAGAIANNSNKISFSQNYSEAVDDNSIFRVNNTNKLNLLDFGGVGDGSQIGLPRIIFGSNPLIDLVSPSSTGQYGVRILDAFSTAQQSEFDGHISAYQGITVGPYQGYNNTSEVFRVYGSANIYSDLFVSGDIQSGDIQSFGVVRAYGDVIAFFQSDKRLKDNIKPIENTLDKVSKLGGYEFDWNDKQDTYEGHDIGVIAQEVEEVFPELVTTRDDGYKAVKYEKLVAVLISAVNELKEEIEQLKSK